MNWLKERHSLSLLPERVCRYTKMTGRCETAIKQWGFVSDRNYDS